MNLPNKITMLRFVLVPVFAAVVMMCPENISRIVGAALFAVIALTDMFDGKIARKYNLVTNFGKFMDSLADKFMIFIALLAIVARYEQTRFLMFWVALVVILRELAVTSIRLIAAKEVVIAASWLGKVKTTIQCIAVEIILLEPVIFSTAKHYPLTLASSLGLLLFAVYSGVDYLLKYGHFLKARS